MSDSIIIQAVRSILDGADVAAATWRQARDGGDTGDAFRRALVDVAIDRARPRILAALRARGLDLPEDREFSEEGLREALAAKTGLDIEELSEDGIANAIRARMARELGRALGIDDLEPDALADPETLRAALVGRAKDAVMSGRANKLMSARAIRQVRAAASWARLGVDPGERARILNRWYQKKYRRNNVQRWAA